MIITGLDTETTGLDPDKGHRIVEIAICHYDIATRQQVDRFVQRIDPQRPIDADAQRVHGIAYTDLVGCPTWDDVAQRVSDELQRSDLIVIHNRDFDAPFITKELGRVAVAMPDVPTFCTMENGRWACFDGKNPRLEELCFALRVNYDPGLAHAADYDVDVMIQCYFKALDRGFYDMPLAA